MITKFHIWEQVNSETDIVNSFLINYPSLGTFDYHKYNWTVDFDSSMFNEPQGSNTLHIVFTDPSSNEWTMFIHSADGTTPYISLTSGPRSNLKIRIPKSESFETMEKTLAKLGVRPSSKI
jgi:hypothetical protein